MSTPDPIASADVLVEYIGPSGQVMFDAHNAQISLVAGRRYPMDAALAAYRVEHDVNHWKRPDQPKPAVIAAAKD
jgi:hypothetical protein